MKKKNVSNLIMVTVILLIAAAGIVGVGFIQGWFDTFDGSQALLQSTRGVVSLMRAGVSYPVENGTVLHPEDTLTCQNGATAVICFGDDQITLGGNASLTVIDPAANAFAAQIHTGEIFAHCNTGATLRIDGKQITVRQATALISVQSGAQSISVLRGTVEEAAAGQILQFIGGEKTVSTLSLHSLNDFAITQIRAQNDPSLCFSTEELDRLSEERRQALQAVINGQETPEISTDDTQNITASEHSVPTETTEPPSAAAPTEPEIPSEPVTPTEPPQATEPPATTPPEPTVSPETAPPEATEPPETAPPAATMQCTLAICCTTILDNMADLDPGKAEFVPSDGVILMPVTVNFTEGETVFDVLKRACDRTGIQLEYSWTPLYNSYYVEGINNLYEFDCGFESGWMYQVNGWFPNYGCSSYTLKDGDVILWLYTCKGLGTDVGAPRME